METKEDLQGSASEHGHRNDVAVAIITPSGIFPSEDTLQRVSEDAPVTSVLQLAADALHLTNTGDWVAHVGEHQIDPTHTFKHLGLRCIVDVEWHKHEGGGGA